MRAAVGIVLDRLEIHAPTDARPPGTRALEGLCRMASKGLRQFHGALKRDGLTGGAAISRVRGTGPGASFGALVGDLERTHPLALVSPFEGCKDVAGAVWECRRLLRAQHSAALLKLRFSAGAVDLPLHTHQRSDRFVFVLEGRGCFHVCTEPVESYSDGAVWNVPVRPRDAIVFTQGILHTFSAPDEPLTLLSFHEPFVGLESSEQYSVPARVTTPRRLFAAAPQGRVGCDAAWTLLG